MRTDVQVTVAARGTAIEDDVSDDDSDNAAEIEAFNFTRLVMSETKQASQVACKLGMSTPMCHAPVRESLTKTLMQLSGV